MTVKRTPAAVVAALILLAGVTGATPLLDGATHRPASGAALATPTGFLLLAPLCTTLDALSLLSVPQHIALLITVALVYAAWRVIKRRRGAGGGSALREVGLALGALVAWLALYAVGALVPRPMAAIRLRDPDVLAVDFHSHTNASWDARKSFGPEANRRWHAAAGFDAAYVSDHRSFANARRAAAGNPPRAGDGTVLLPALEVRDHGLHINVLGVHPVPLDTVAGDWDERLASDAAAPPLTLLTIPGRLTALPDSAEWSHARFVAIELADASPRGIGEEDRDRARILHLADSLDLATVAGSDNHGWGRTAAAWTTMRIPGWRTLAPAALDSAIRSTLVTRRRLGASVIERDSPDPGRSPVALALTGPAVVWTLLRDLGPWERVSWLVWIAVLVVAAGWRAASPADGRRDKRHR